MHFRLESVRHVRVLDLTVMSNETIIIKMKYNPLFDSTILNIFLTCLSTYLILVAVIMITQIPFSFF